MQLLDIDVSQFGTAEGNAENIRAALRRDLPELQPALCSHDGTFVIVGSGPSLPLFADAIRDEQANGRPICAVKGAHDFLCEHDILPELFCSVEPRDRRENLKHANPYTTYLLASRVHPAVFDHLKDRKVVRWHSWSDQPECDVWRGVGKFGIGGGTTSGLRAINVGYVLGFRKFRLYGLDSCLADDKSTKRFTGEKAGAIIDVIVGGRTFWCNHAMAQQAQDFQQLYKVMSDMTVESFGDGLITAILAERRKQGLRT